MTIDAFSMHHRNAQSARETVNARRVAVASRARLARRVYPLIGPDGAGKTTIARDLAQLLLRHRIRSRISWMRSPRIVTLAMLGILRLSRLAKAVRMGDHDDVHTDLSRHPALMHLYAWSVTFDYFLGYLGKVTIPQRLFRRAVICDRFVWDALVDLGLASGLDERFLELPQGRILLDLAKKHGGVLVIAAPEELLRRRPILSLDPRLARRLRLYEAFADRFGLGRVDSGTTSEPACVSIAAEHLGIPRE